MKESMRRLKRCTTGGLALVWMSTATPTVGVVKPVVP